MTTKAEFADFLLGSCKFIDEAMEIFGVDETFAFQAIEDADIDCCEQCGWWCEGHEFIDNMICEQCREETD